MKKLSAGAFYKIRDPKNFFAAMKSDVELLRNHHAYVSLSTVIFCCVDALAAGTGEATYGKFEKFVVSNFPVLCQALDGLCAPKRGSRVLYDDFRNGFAHLRGPKTTYAIAEDHELDGDWADQIEVEGGVQLIAINIDLLARTFSQILEKLERDALQASK